MNLSLASSKPQITGWAFFFFFFPHCAFAAKGYNLAPGVIWSIGKEQDLA